LRRSPETEPRLHALSLLTLRAHNRLRFDLECLAATLSPRLYLNTGATAAAVAYDCAGLYLETDY
jgi:hypothetical protein